ncbi:MAG: lipoyl(octanoyl) transferase LipB [Gammaproteobacteria bacterium]
MAAPVPHTPRAYPDDSGRLRVRELGLADYETVWRDMQAFTARRSAASADELWLVQHPPVFTVGLNGKPEHLLAPGDIPVLPVDRGGQVTYHGPGQLVAYVLVDIARRSLGVQTLVRTLEQAVVDLLADYGLSAAARRDAPGVYVDGSKIASLGLRIKRGRSYHGLALNVDMDLEPFGRINPCGHPGMIVTQLRDLGISPDFNEVSARLQSHLVRLLGYTVAP